MYGLKQAHHAWFQRLSTFLLQQRFRCSQSDSSLFVFHNNSCILYLLVYVENFITRLHTEFSIKYMGTLTYFMCLEVSYTPDGLLLNQSKYVHDIMTFASLLDSKPVATPLSTNDTFVSTGTSYSDPTQYRSLVGKLQYLTITRPDLSYAVNTTSQFSHAPTVDHFQMVKRILCYVKGTLAYGLKFSNKSTTSLTGYSDADWSRCIETRRAIYGYSIFLGGNLVS